MDVILKLELSSVNAAFKNINEKKFESDLKVFFINVPWSTLYEEFDMRKIALISTKTIKETFFVKYDYKTHSFPRSFLDARKMRDARFWIQFFLFGIAYVI